MELNLPVESTSFFKKDAKRIALQLQKKVQQLLTDFDKIAPVNTDSITTGNTFINTVIKP